MGYVDKIMLSKCRTKFVVFMIDGPSLTVDFGELGMNVIEGLDYVEGIFNGTISVQQAA